MQIPQEKHSIKKRLLMSKMLFLKDHATKMIIAELDGETSIFWSIPRKSDLGFFFRFTGMNF